MRIKQESISQTIDELLLTAYPNIQHYLVLISSNTDNYNESTSEAFSELRSEIYSLFNYDVKLVFPALLSAIQSSNNYKNFDIFSMLDLLQKKEEKVVEVFIEFQKSLDSNSIGQREKDFFEAFQNEFMALHSRLSLNVKQWVSIKVRS